VFVHSDNSKAEKSETTEEDGMVHGGVATGVNQTKKPYVEVDGAYEDRFEIVFGE
jgi:hypothetical protein